MLMVHGRIERAKRPSLRGVTGRERTRAVGETILKKGERENRQWVRQWRRKEERGRTRAVRGRGRDSDIGTKRRGDE